MIHPDTELRFINLTMGYGVFATRLIPQGTITWVRDDLDQTFSLEAVARMRPEYQRLIEKYSFVDAQGQVVLCWDHARYVNHSCAATCFSAGYDFEFAIRDIRPGDELTDDYGTLNLREPFHCACRMPACRQVIRPDDMERLAVNWDGVVQQVFPRLAVVEQPLWVFLREKAEVETVLEQRTPPRSIRFNYARPRP